MVVSSFVKVMTCCGVAAETLTTVSSSSGGSGQNG